MHCHVFKAKQLLLLQLEVVHWAYFQLLYTLLEETASNFVKASRERLGATYSTMIFTVAQHVTHIVMVYELLQ